MPMVSFAEEVANLYYLQRGYFVIRNYQYLGKTNPSNIQPGNIDIDLISIKENEINVVSCKRGSLNKKQTEKEIYLFHQADDVLRREFSWIDKKPTYIYFAEWITKQNYSDLAGENVKVISLKKAVTQIIIKIQEDFSQTNTVGRETEILPRILKFLVQHNFFSEK